MKGKITWLNWSLKKKIRKNGERYIVIQGRVEEIDFTSQVPAQVWKGILGSKWRKSVDHKPASREHSGDWSDLGVTLHHDTPTSFIKSLSTWCLAGVDFLSLWKSPQQHFSEPRLLRSVIAVTGMATEVEMGSYAEKKSWKKNHRMWKDPTHSQAHDLGGLSQICQISKGHGDFSTWDSILKVKNRFSQ